MKDCNEVCVSLSHLQTEVLESICISYRLIRNVGTEWTAHLLPVEIFLSFYQLGVEFLQNKLVTTRYFGQVRIQA